MIVSPASRMLRAISLGVFWRSAPSTSAIMRSRNVWPGSDVMRTTISSDSTRVPPVTALRSPPLSRMTGADSPVMADSSTEAMPSITSPSPGMISPAETTTTSPLRSALAAIVLDRSVDAQVGECLRLRPAQGVGLSLAAPLGHGRREVGEDDREPQPAAHHAGEGDVRTALRDPGDEGDGGDDAADLDHEHHGVAGDLAEGRAWRTNSRRRARSEPRMDAPERAGPGGVADGPGVVARRSSAAGVTTRHE